MIKSLAVEPKKDYVEILKREIKGYNELKARCNVLKQRINDIEDMLKLEAAPGTPTFQMRVQGGSKTSKEESFLITHEEYTNKIILLRREVYKLETRIHDIDCCINSLNSNEKSVIEAFRNGYTWERIAEECFISVGGARNIVGRTLKKMAIIIYGFE